jgi:hypothetical protein
MFMIRVLKGFAALALGVMMATPAHAGKWSNQFVEFELPAEWVCLLEGTEWVCQNGLDQAKKKEAIIILAAKLQGNQDTLDQYLSYLKTPKVYTNAQGKQITSEVKTAQNRTILEQPWVDSLHVDSEIAGFYTRYLATVKEGLGILVTYSVNKNKYADYTAMFDNMVKSLKAFRREGGLNAAPASSNLFGSAKVPTTISNDTVFAPVAGASDEKPKKIKKPGMAGMLDDLMADPVTFYGGIGAVVLLVLLALKKKRS